MTSHLVPWILLACLLASGCGLNYPPVGDVTAEQPTLLVVNGGFSARHIYLEDRFLGVVDASAQKCFRISSALNLQLRVSGESSSGYLMTVPFSTMRGDRFWRLDLGPSDLLSSVGLWPEPGPCR